MKTSDLNYPGILKYGDVFNMMNLELKGATLLRAVEELKINNFAIHVGLRKLTLGKAIIHPNNSAETQVGARRDDNLRPKLTLWGNRGVAWELAQNTFPRPNGRGVIKIRWEGARNRERQNGRKNGRGEEER